MSALHLTVDSVDNVASYSTNGDPITNIKGISLWIRLLFSSGNPIPRNIWAGGTDYSETRVAAILRDFLQPDTKLSLQEAAKAILVLIPANASGYAEVCSFGEICVELAEQIPYHHPSQLKLA